MAPSCSNGGPGFLRPGLSGLRPSWDLSRSWWRARAAAMVETTSRSASRGSRSRVSDRRAAPAVRSARPTAPSPPAPAVAPARRVTPAPRAQRAAAAPAERRAPGERRAAPGSRWAPESAAAPARTWDRGTRRRDGKRGDHRHRRRDRRHHRRRRVGRRGGPRRDRRRRGGDGDRGNGRRSRPRRQRRWRRRLQSGRANRLRRRTAMRLDRHRPDHGTQGLPRRRNRRLDGACTYGPLGETTGFEYLQEGHVVHLRRLQEDLRRDRGARQLPDQHALRPLRGRAFDLEGTLGIGFCDRRATRSRRPATVTAPPRAAAPTQRAHQGLLRPPQRRFTCATIISTTKTQGVLAGTPTTSTRVRRATCR